MDDAALRIAPQALQAPSGCPKRDSTDRPNPLGEPSEFWRRWAWRRTATTPVMPSSWPSNIRPRPFNDGISWVRKPTTTAWLPRLLLGVGSVVAELVLALTAVVPSELL